MNLKYRSIFFLMLCICLSACYEKKTGCLDIYATNYSFDADAECVEPCCTFPLFKLNLVHLFNEQPFVLKDTVENNLGQPFIVLSQKFYFSDIKLFTDRENIVFYQTENIPFLNKPDVVIEKNFKLIRDLITTATVNQIKAVDTILRAKINMGMVDFYSGIDVNAVVTGSDLAAGTAMMDTTGNYFSYVATILRGTDLKDTVVVNLNQSFEKELFLNPAIKQVPGNEVTIDVKLNYFNFFKDVHFNTATDQEIKMKLEDNLKFILD